MTFLKASPAFFPAAGFGDLALGRSCADPHGNSQPQNARSSDSGRSPRDLHVSSEVRAILASCSGDSFPHTVTGFCAREGLDANAIRRVMACARRGCCLLPPASGAVRPSAERHVERRLGRRAKARSARASCSSCNWDGRGAHRRHRSRTESRRDAERPTLDPAFTLGRARRGARASDAAGAGRAYVIDGKLEEHRRLPARHLPGTLDRGREERRFPDRSKLMIGRSGDRRSEWPDVDRRSPDRAIVRISLGRWRRSPITRSRDRLDLNGQMPDRRSPDRAIA